MKRLLALLFCLGILGVSGRAWAKPNHFVGAHPVAAAYGGGYCYIDVPHVHAYAPDRAPLYQQTPDGAVFIGDPSPFGYEGDRNVFYGHHPVVGVLGDPIYCYIDGPHYHPYAPPSGPDYQIKDDVAFYVGPYSPAYYKLKPGRVKVVNAQYRPFVTFRPTVQVTPPPEWHGDVVVVGSPPPAGVVVTAPPPPSVVVTAPPPPHVVVTAPPPPGVIVTAPPPVVVVHGHGHGHGYGRGHGYYGHPGRGWKHGHHKKWKH